MKLEERRAWEKKVGWREPREKREPPWWARPWGVQWPKEKPLRPERVSLERMREAEWEKEGKDS